MRMHESSSHWGMVLHLPLSPTIISAALMDLAHPRHDQSSPHITSAAFTLWKMAMVLLNESMLPPPFCPELVHGLEGPALFTS